MLNLPHLPTLFTFLGYINMLNKLITIIAISAVTLSVLPSPAYAVTTPSFPSCVNPQGSLKVQYDNGTHGIVGRTATFTGSDKVYQLSGNDQLMQCFCPENGNGIQTNWWKVANLSESDIKMLTNDGWTYVADGSAWGLDNAPYVAKNSDYNCKPANNATTNSSIASTPTSTVSNPVKEVLNLASTGNTAFLYSLIALGSTSLLAGLLLKFKKS